MEPGTASAQADIRTYLRVLRRRRWLVLLAIAVVVGAAVTASLLQTSVYEGTAEILLQDRNSEALFGPNGGQRSDPQRNVDTEIQVLKSAPVREAVTQKVGSTPRVSANAVGQTDVIEVKARNTSPAQAAAVANAYANAYIDFRRKQAVDSLLAASNEVQKQINNLQKQIDDFSTQVTSAPPGQRNAVEQNVAPRRDALVSQQAVFKQRQDQLQVDASLASGGAQLVTSASTPTSPVSPKPKRTAAVALLLGGLLGVGLAFLLEYLDDSVKTKEDLERGAPGVPTLAVIPEIAAWKAKDQARLVSVTEPTSSAAEAYRSLRTAIQFMALDQPMRTLQVTSPSASEGKTTTLANLGVALARAGQRVVLVDCDLRRPRIHDFFGVPNDVGFTSVLLGEVSLSEAVQEVPGERLIMMLSSGVLPPNPSELLSSNRTVQVLAALQAESDMVLIDCPPVLPVTDASVLSHRVDATLLVTTSGQTNRKELARAVELLRQVEAPIVGTVLNGVSDEEAYGYAHKYGYYYRPDEPSPGGVVKKLKL